jgi:proprotein convertase subtilisin/kexin type 5
LSDSCLPCNEPGKGRFFSTVWKCINCDDPTNCRRCNNANGYCEECNLNYFLDDSNPKKCVLCTNKLTTFPQNIPTCPTTCDIDNCDSFISDGVCGKCNSNYFLSFYLDSCISTCTPSTTINQYYHDCDDSNYCLLKNECVSNCDKCITPQECQVCADGYYLTDDKLCAKCAAECTKCSNVKTCSACATNFFLTTVGSCIACTSDGQFKSVSNCIICTLANCKTCSAETDISCTKCRTGFYLLTVGGVNSCDECQVGYTINGDNCRKCADFRCINCAGSSGCSECAQGYFLKTDGATVTCDVCVSADSPGWYRSNDPDRISRCLKTSCSDLNSCVEFKSGTVCTNCGTDSYIKFSTRWEDTVCVSCDNAATEKKIDLYCYFSNDCTPNCDLCENSYQCKTCASTHFLTTDLTCSVCKTGCSKCAWSDGCTECPTTSCLLGDECVPYTTEGIASGSGGI